MSLQTRLLKIARRVRNALEKEATQFEQYKSKWSRSAFSHHPPSQYQWCSYGQCDVTSQILEQVLIDEGIGIENIVYVMGLIAVEEPNPGEEDLDEETKEMLGIPQNKFAAYHYWIEVTNSPQDYDDKRPANVWVIDITADQFNDLIDGRKFPKVIVAKYKDLPRHFRSGPA